MSLDVKTTASPKTSPKLGKSKKIPSITIYIKTGDVKRAGTDNDVLCILYDTNGNTTKPLDLDNRFHNDFERGRTDTFKFYDIKDLGHISKIELWRDGFLNDEWFVETFIVENHITGNTHVFPIHRWVPRNTHLHLKEYDSHLPQFDENSDQRKEELLKKQKVYLLANKAPGMPMQAKEFPPAESFSDDYKWDIAKRKLKLLLSGKFKKLGERFKKISDIHELYGSKTFPKPKNLDRDWMSDEFFAEQRLVSCNPNQIRLCTEIPQNFAVTNDMISPFLEGHTLTEAVKEKKIFLINHDILQDVNKTYPDHCVCVPMALFYKRNDDVLIPVAIQLFQTPSPDNPVFVPSDPKWTWFLAKMWFNNADAAVHQAVTHFGSTHMLMESVSVCTNRQLSPSHPLYRFLAPHFLYIVAINWLGLSDLVSPNGWVDESMSFGRLGLFDIVARQFSKWRANVQGILPRELEERGVSDPEVLPNYPYRDDALLIFEAIQKYSNTVIQNIYDTAEKVKDDFELQAWIKELTDPLEEGGCGFQGLPKVFTTSEEIAEWITVVIYTCSVAHAAANFSQYDDYCFPPTYPPILNGNPPKDKSEKSEQDVLDCLPSRKQTVNIMIVGQVLSQRGTQPLGDFEMQYAFDPFTTKAVDQLKEDMKKAEEIMKDRNTKRKHPYDLLYPSEVPNSISI